MAKRKQFLNAEEAEDNPAILRHPDARQKRRNRSGQAAGISKEHIPGPFNWRLVEMQKSPAYRVLSLSARKVLDRLEIELAQHGFKSEENGNLPCTYVHFVEYGVESKAVARAIRELVALGFVEITQQGSAGNAEHRQPTLYLLTYRPFGSHKYIGNGWRRIGDIEEAEAVAAAARGRPADTRASTLGRKGGVASHAKKQIPASLLATNPASLLATKEGRFSPPFSPVKNAKPPPPFSPAPLESPHGGAKPATRTNGDGGHVAMAMANLPWSPQPTPRALWGPADDGALPIEYTEPRANLKGERR
jgi:hypothetical protein